MKLTIWIFTWIFFKFRRFSPLCRP